MGVPKTDIKMIREIITDMDNTLVDLEDKSEGYIKHCLKYHMPALIKLMGYREGEGGYGVYQSGMTRAEEAGRAPKKTKDAFKVDG